MTRIGKWIVLVLVACAAAGCSDEGDPVAPGNGAPDTELSYDDEIQSIFDQRCGPSCHGASGNGGLDLRRGQSYGDLVNAVSPNYGAARVVPNEPDASVLFNKITNTGLYGPLMPPGGPALSNTNVELVRAWILAGAPNGVFELPSQ